MLSWIVFLVMNLFLPVLMIGFGKLFIKHAPERINKVYGYRTAMSMKNEDTWKFAQHYFGNLWYKGGLILLPVSVCTMLLVFGRSETAVVVTGISLQFLQLLCLIGVIIPTEAALSKNFDREGKRRENSL